MSTLVEKPVVLAITGTYCGGKSTVAMQLRKNGYPVLDADLEAKKWLREDPSILSTIFGEAILDGSTGAVDPDKLRHELFTSKLKRQALLEKTKTEFMPQLVGKAKTIDSTLVFVEVPLLFEVYGNKSWRNHFTAAIAIICSREESIRRGMERSHLTREEIERILDAQFSEKEKSRYAELPFDTTGKSEQDTIDFVNKYWKRP